MRDTFGERRPRCPGRVNLGGRARVPGCKFHLCDSFECLLWCLFDYQLTPVFGQLNPSGKLVLPCKVYQHSIDADLSCISLFCPC